MHVPLNALQAIESVARLGGLRPAADELGVTIGAVSQQIRRAEQRLGRALFERSPRGLVPSSGLRAALPLLAQGFSQIAEADRQLQAGDGAGVLTLTVGSVFASRWLIWRVNRFAGAHPELELRLVVTGQVLDLGRADIDCGIRFGSGVWPGVRARKVGGFTASPVVSPMLAGELRRPDDLKRLPLIRDEASMLDWAAWWRSAGAEPPESWPGPSYSDPSLAFDAAISGQGVLLAVDMMSADAVSDKRLVRPFAAVTESESGYFLVEAEGRRTPPKVRAFAEWLALEVPDSARGYVHQIGMATADAARR